MSEPRPCRCGMPTYRRDESGAPECAECQYKRTLRRLAPLLAYAELKEKQPMNEPNNHTILGDLAAVVEQHGGSWRIEAEPLGHAFWHVSWLPPARANGEIRRPVSCTRPSIEAAAASVLACIEHFTRPDGGLDL